MESAKRNRVPVSEFLEKIPFCSPDPRTDFPEGFRIMKFRMPPYEGEQDSLVILTEKDALENYLLEDYCARPISPVVIQGADIMNGLLYLPTGVGDEKRPSILYVWDLRTRTMRNVVNLQEAIPVEMEDCAPYAGTMMVQCQRCLYQIRF